MKKQKKQNQNSQEENGKDGGAYLAKIECRCPRCGNSEYSIEDASVDEITSEFLKCKQCGYEGRAYIY